jgi:hypothetical protein
MIRVTVELVSGIDPSRSRLLGIAEIANDMKTTAETGGLFGSYNVRVADPEAPLEDFIVRLSKWAPKERETWKRGRVEKFDRRKRGSWDLLYLALRAIVGGRNP